MDGTEIYKFKGKDSEIAASPLCLGNILKDWSTDNMKNKTGFNGYVYDFSVNYDGTDIDHIKSIHKYLMEKIKKCRINNLIKIRKCNSIELYFNEKSRSSQVINVNSNNPIFYPCSIKTNKCSGNCSNINYPYAKICVPDIIKNLNVKAFN